MLSPKRFIFAFIALFSLCAFSALCVYYATTPKELRDLIAKYKHITPTLWGEDLSGVTRALPSAESSVLYLTFDACGGRYDRELIEFLIAHNIKATLFINARWIKAHSNDFIALSQNPLFSLQNHGSKHLPLSANGKSIYNIKGTDSIRAIYNEIKDNERLFLELGVAKPRYFRSGTAYYDEVSVAMLKDLGYEIAGFDVLGDKGATLSKEQILEQLKLVKNGSILLYHFNHPESETREGIKAAIPYLQSLGFEFGKL